jgi:hypothetical protein
MGRSQALGWQEFALIKLKLLYRKFMWSSVSSACRAIALATAGVSGVKLRTDHERFRYGRH